MIEIVLGGGSSSSVTSRPAGALTASSTVRRSASWTRRTSAGGPAGSTCLRSTCTRRLASDSLSKRPARSLCARHLTGLSVMGVTPEQDRMFRARQLAAASVAGGDDTGWFERLYAEGEAGTSIVPWVLGEPNESLVEWAAGRRRDGPARARRRLRDRGRRGVPRGPWLRGHRVRHRADRDRRRTAPAPGLGGALPGRRPARPAGGMVGCLRPRRRDLHGAAAVRRGPRAGTRRAARPGRAGRDAAGDLLGDRRGQTRCATRR